MTSYEDGKADGSAMTLVQMRDSLDTAMYKLCLLSEIFQSNINADECHDGLAYLVDEVFEDVDRVGHAIDARLMAERKVRL